MKTEAGPKAGPVSSTTTQNNSGNATDRQRSKRSNSRLRFVLTTARLSRRIAALNARVRRLERRLGALEGGRP